jgi:hypothetical protein
LQKVHSPRSSCFLVSTTPHSPTNNVPRKLNRAKTPVSKSDARYELIKRPSLLSGWLIPRAVADDEVGPVEALSFVGDSLGQHVSLGEVMGFEGSLLEETSLTESESELMEAGSLIEPISKAEPVSDAVVDVDELDSLSGVPMGHKLDRTTSDDIFALLIMGE